MNRKYSHFLGLISLGIILGAGGGIFLEMPPVIAAGETKQNQDLEKQAIQALIEQEIKAINSKNIEAMQNNYHPNSPAFKQKRLEWEQLFKQTDIKTELNKVEFMKIEKNEATAKITTTSSLTYRNVEYKEQKITVISKFQKYQGRWKFYSSELDKIELIK